MEAVEHSEQVSVGGSTGFAPVDSAAVLPLLMRLDTGTEQLRPPYSRIEGAVGYSKWAQLAKNACAYCAPAWSAMSQSTLSPGCRAACKPGHGLQQPVTTRTISVVLHQGFEQDG